MSRNEKHHAPWMVIMLIIVVALTLIFEGIPYLIDMHLPI